MPSHTDPRIDASDLETRAAELFAADAPHGLALFSEWESLRPGNPLADLIRESYLAAAARSERGSRHAG